MQAYLDTFEKHKTYFDTGVTRDVEWRKQQLSRLADLIKENKNAVFSALQKDLGKSKQEAYITEVGYVLSDIKHKLKRIKKWSRAKKVKTPLAAMPAHSFIQPQPLGTVLIIGAWNYPFQLLLAPFVAAISAGNCAILKPSELAPNVSQLIADLVPKYLDEKAFSVVQGGKDETSGLLELSFNKIFYTGGEVVGKIVMTAAAKHLTPVTLELGGKSPCVVDTTADLAVTANRIVWGKFMNAGQTCIAPDYILVEPSIKQQLIDELIKAIETQYTATPKTSKDYGRIVNERHCQRLSDYLSNQKVVYGGDVDIQQKYMAPTLVVDPELSDPLMQEEIFGPILPIVEMNSRNAMLSFIQQRPQPLAAYLFTQDDEFEYRFVDEVSAGNMCINDISMFALNHELPFGGVGTSGMGRYHGKFGFDTFSHHKAVMHRSFSMENTLRYAPFSKIKFWLLKRFI
ncbi:aldehyde dehydrogenase family protein [Glaciecola sp. 1036]|uniref:aldehyde dehydrogenase family protein n=1 Tax=Alteromonadaceae TaxID=72275 RepID=UPI003D08186B